MFSLGKFSDKNLLDTSFLITNICGLQLVSNFFVINSIFLDFFTILFKKPLLSFYKGKLCKKKDCKSLPLYQGFKCSHIKVTPSFLREKARKVTPLLEYGGWRARGAIAPLAVLALVAQPLPRAKAPTLIRCGLNAHLRRFFLRTVPQFTKSFSHSF